MKRFRTLVVLSASAMLIGTVAVAFAAGRSELDIASATFTANPTAGPNTIACSAEDTLGSPWVMAKTTGKWKGTITDTSPASPWNAASPDIGIAGHVTVTGTVIGDGGPFGAGGSLVIVTGWGKLSVTTIPLGFTAKTTLAKYSGVAQIVTQANQGNIEGRGQLIAKFFTRPTTTTAYAWTGDYLVANLEMTISGTTFAVAGQFGGPAGGPAGTGVAQLDYSVETTEKC